MSRTYVQGLRVNDLVFRGDMSAMQVAQTDAIVAQEDAEAGRQNGKWEDLRALQVEGRLFVQPIGHSTLQAGGHCEGDELMRAGDRLHQRRRPGHPPHLHKHRSRSDGSAR